MESTSKENGYSSILKRISSFGGVQVFNIIVTLIRGKFVALLLGPEGMGISSMFTTSTNTIQQFSSLGLNLAIVKEIAAGKEDKSRLSHILSLSLKLIMLTALLGAGICVIISPFLSKWSFGDYSYTGSFIFLAAGVALSIAGAGYLSLLQGLGEVKRLSKASIVGGLTGLVVGVPLYYFWGNKGIVPAMIILALSTFLFYYFSLETTKPAEKQVIKLKAYKPLIKKMVSLGLILMTGSLAGSFASYVINIFIRELGSVDNVGLFQAANSITNQYVGIIFSALALDYFPRLSAIVSIPEKMIKVVNRQAEIVIVVMTPLILALFLTAPWIIRILLSDSFLPVTPLVKWLALGVLLQGITFPLGYLFIANENRKVYFWMEVIIGNAMWIGFSFLFYWLFDLIGLGISLVVRTSLDIFLSYIVCRKFYGFRYNLKTIMVSTICLFLGVGGFLLSILAPEAAMLWLTVIFLISIIFSVYILLVGIRNSNTD